MSATPLMNAIKEYLELKGFKVVLNGYIKGISGIKHQFNIIAKDSKNILCIQFYNPKVIFLDIFGRAVDLPFSKVIAVTEEIDRESINPEIDNLKIFKCDKPDKFLKELEKEINIK